MLLCDKRRDERNGIIVCDGGEESIAVRAAIPSLVMRLQFDVELPMKLAELAFKFVACDQGVTAAEEFTLGQVSVASKQPPILSDHALEQGIVPDDLFVGGVVAENAQPPGEAAEHCIGHEARRGIAGGGKHLHTRRVLLSEPLDRDSARTPLR